MRSSATSSRRSWSSRTAPHRHRLGQGRSPHHARPPALMTGMLQTSEPPREQSCTAPRDVRGPDSVEGRNLFTVAITRGSAWRTIIATDKNPNRRLRHLSASRTCPVPRGSSGTSPSHAADQQVPLQYSQVKPMPPLCWMVSAAIRRNASMLRPGCGRDRRGRRLRGGDGDCEVRPAFPEVPAGRSPGPVVACSRVGGRIPRSAAPER
jgi:hypothetical protein